MNDKNKQDQTTIYGETKTSRAIVKCSHHIPHVDEMDIGAH